MTGDSSRRKQALSVFLSTLMVLSVLAMGMAGFAGSAAAASQSDSDGLSDGSGYIVADPANSYNDATHTIQLQSNDSLGSNNLDYINVSYDEVDVSGLDQEQTASAGLGNDVTVYVDGSAINDANVTTKENSINISNIDDTDDSISLSAGTSITLELGATAGINNSDGYNVDVSLEDDGHSNTQTFSGLQLGVDDGPIEVDQSGTTVYWNTFYRGVENASSSGHTVTVTEDLDETLPTAATADLQSSGVTIQGQSSPVINVSGLSANVINLNSETNLTVDDLTIDGDGLSSSAITGTTTNTTISANTFQDVTGTTISLDTSDGNADTLDISDNTFTGEQGKAIEVDPGLYTDEADTVTIDSNDITRDSGGAAAIDIDTGSGVGQVDITGGTIEGDAGSDDTGISTHNENVTIDGVTINATYTGIDAAQTGETLVISGTTITNLAGSSGSPVAIDADDTNSVTAITVNESTSIDQATTGISVDLSNNGGSTADIDNVDVNGTTNGVDIFNVGQNADAVNITNSVFTQNTNGLSFDGDADATGARYDVHFNTFENNDDGVDVPTDPSGGDLTYNVTFNDFVDNNENGVNIQNGISTGSLNANYNWWDNRDSSRIVGPYTPQNAGSQLPIPRRVYSYTRLHTGGQP